MDRGTVAPVRWLWRGAGVALSMAALAGLATLAARYVRARQPLLDRVRAFNRRRLNPLTLGIAGRRGDYYHVLRHVGRRSGRIYATPLEAFPVGDAFVIPLTYGMRCDWARNTLAAGGATLLREGEALVVIRPRVVPLAAVSHALPLIERLGLRALGIGELLLVERAAQAGDGSAPSAS